MRRLAAVLVTAAVCMGIFMQTQSDAKEKTRIVFVKDDDGDFFKAVGTLIESLLDKKGWNKGNCEFIVLSMEGKEEKGPEVAKKIKSINPAVVLINTTLIQKIAVELKDAGIPCVAGGGLELEDGNGRMVFVDSSGFPTTNLTGTYTMPREQLKYSFAFLDRVAPLKKRKVVFATYPSAAFTRSKVEKALKELNMSLKDYKEFTFIEDYQDFVKKYNADDEVGWIISGEMISRRKDGSAYTFEEFFKWERENSRKPNLGFWENSVQCGKLCALAIDSMTTVNQMVTMADRIARGEKVSKVKPEDPGKTLIILNQKRARDLKIEFPMPVLQGAWRIYSDYDGNYIDRK